VARLLSKDEALRICDELRVLTGFESTPPDIFAGGFASELPRIRQDGAERGAIVSSAIP
jgi:hypothetical protein